MKDPSNEPPLPRSTSRRPFLRATAAGAFSAFGTTLFAGCVTDIGANDTNTTTSGSTATRFPTTQVAKLTASDGKADDEFGWSVSIDSDTALVGAANEGAKGSNGGAGAGAAYVFE